MIKKLKRIPEKGWIGGVCSGFAYHFGTPVWVVRLIWVVATLGMGAGFWLYILFWIFMPAVSETPSDYTKRVGDN